MSEAAEQELRQKHIKEARKHEIKMHIHWMTLAHNRELWKKIVRGPEPEPTQRAHRARGAVEQPPPTPQPPASPLRGASRIFRPDLPPIIATERSVSIAT